MNELEKVEELKEEKINLEQLKLVFSMARLQQVNSAPEDVKTLAELINFEQKVIEALS